MYYHMFITIITSTITTNHNNNNNTLSGAGAARSRSSARPAGRPAEGVRLYYVIACHISLYHVGL